MLAAATALQVLIVAVDLPQFEASLLRILHAQVAPGIGAAAWSGRGWEPLVGIYPREALASARERLRTRCLALWHWVEHLHEAGRVRRVEVPPALPGQLRNINTPEELGNDRGGISAPARGTQANVSRHLQTLIAAHILSRRKEGLQVYYRVSDPSISKLCQLVCGSLEKSLLKQAGSFGA